MDEYYIAVFASKNHAVELHHILARKGYNYELISTPCQLTAGCSYSIKFTHIQSIKHIIDTANEYNKEIKDIYKIYRRDGKKVAERVVKKS